MCPVLAITTTAVNGLGMGLATMAVLICSNLFISLLRGFVPPQARIPGYVVVIASFVTVVEFLLKAYLPRLDSALGVFIPLIVVNCIILARAEVFAAKNAPIPSVLDGIGMGLGFTSALFIIGVARELLGGGTFLSDTPLAMTLPETFPRTIIMILPPGAFITLGIIMAALNHIRYKKGGARDECVRCVSGCGSCK